MAKFSRKASLGLAMLMALGTAAAQDGALKDRDPDGTWRFHMTQNGKVMTADDFTAWMEQRGLSVGARAPGSMPASYQSGHSQPQPIQPQQGERLMAIHSPSLVPQGAHPAPLQVSQPHIAQWEPASQPIQTAPQNRPQINGDGNLMGYDSSWNEGGASYSSGYSGGPSSGGYSSGSRSSSSLNSYDSGRDY